MIKIPDSVLIFYIVFSVLGFSLRFFKDGVFKNLSIKPLMERLGVFALAFLPFVGLLLLGQFYGSHPDSSGSVALTAANTLPFFSGAACLSYFLSGIGLPSYLRGIVLSGACVALTSLVPVDFVALASTITGLILAKFCENIPAEKNSSLDDILPPFCWLTAVMWITSVNTVKDQPMQAGLILGIMSVSLMMRFLQGPFVFVGKLEDDKIFVKRVMLSLTAGLAVLCVVVKMLNLLHFQSLALICAAGYFISYLYKDLDGESRYALAPMQGLRLLILIGLMTLVATRLYGTFGLLALAPTAMVAPVSSAVLIPGIFFCSRALLQVYLQHFNENVTGINLTHAYASAAQYAGFLLGIALLLLIREKINRKVLLSITLSVCIVVPILSNFLLNSEPSCSLFASVVVSSLLVAVLAPALQGTSTADGAENICLVPGLMISSGILTSGLLELGNSATKMIKGTVLSYGIIFVILMSFIFWFFFQRKADKNNTAASADSI